MHLNELFRGDFLLACLKCLSAGVGLILRMNWCCIWDCQRKLNLASQIIPDKWIRNSFCLGLLAISKNSSIRPIKFYVCTYEDVFHCMRFVKELCRLLLDHLSFSWMLWILFYSNELATVFIDVLSSPHLVWSFFCCVSFNAVINGVIIIS